MPACLTDPTTKRIALAPDATHRPFRSDAKGCSQQATGIRSKQYKNSRVAAAALNVSYSTLRERINGKHRAHAEVAAQRRLLDPEQEQVLKDWAEQKAENGTPMDKRDLRGYASLISGQRAGK
ncbi:hypothetical protein FA15DRAFT_747467, partial [Coprinopsis marcescibilis]